MSSHGNLGFPAPLLGMDPVRLRVLYDDGEILALSKPVEILVQKDPWYPRLPVLIEAIRYQAARRKPEFRKAGIGENGLWPVYDLDPECHGPVLFARSRQVAEDLRNELGSMGFSFHFELLTPSADGPPEVACDLPLARHVRAKQMVVSHTTGKTASTVFQRSALVGALCLASATTAFPRRHQVLLHGMESGFPVLGDRIYARSPLPLLSRLKRDYRSRSDREERPLYPGPALFLREVRVGSRIHVTSPNPPRWDALLKQLHRYSPPGSTGKSFT